MSGCSNDTSSIGIGSCNDYKLQKQKRTLDLAQEARMCIIRDTSIAFPKKRPFRPIDRTPEKRRKKRTAEARLMFAPFHYAIQLSLILAEPIPKYPKGDYIGERCPELVVMPAGSKVYLEGQLIGKVNNGMQ